MQQVELDNGLGRLAALNLSPKSLVCIKQYAETIKYPAFWQDNLAGYITYILH